jgi:hypothetical protein
MGVPAIASVRRTDPAARVIFASDEDTAWDILAPLADRTLRIAPGMPLWIADAEAQRQALWDCQDGDELWFLDTDTVLLKPMPEIIADLAFTWRDNWRVKEGKTMVGMADQMPYNGGVTGARVSLAALDGVTWLKHRIMAMSELYRHWWGDQFAASELCGPRPPSDCEIRNVRLPIGPVARGSEIKLQLMPCTTFNYWPSAAGEDLSEKYVLHFKGKAARHLMADYLTTLDLPQPLTIAPPTHLIEVDEQ